MVASDRTRLRLPRRLLVLCVLALSLALVAASQALAASSPTIAITAPTSGATVKGTVHVEATATASPDDYPTQIVFYDGVTDLGGISCQGQQVCSGFVEWRATGLSGQHALTARAYTNEGQSATSAAVAVTVVSPPPTISVTTPTAAANVKGTVMVRAEAATDPSQDDYPTSIAFYDGVNNIGSVDCQRQQTCQGQVEWRATGLSGTHTLTARVYTNRSLLVTSAPVTVTVLSPPPTVAITHPTSGAPLRGTITVTVAGATDPSQDDYPGSIYVYDGKSEVGSVSCQGQQTCSGSIRWSTSGLKGLQVLRATIRTNRDKEATSRPVYVGGFPPRPHARVTCHIASLHIRKRHRDRGSCVAFRVPPGTAVAIQYRTSGSGWSTAVRGRISRNGRYFFTLQSSKRAVYQISVLVGANSRYAATRVFIGTLHVR